MPAKPNMLKIPIRMAIVNDWLTPEKTSLCRYNKMPMITSSATSTVQAIVAQMEVNFGKFDSARTQKVPFGDSCTRVAWLIPKNRTPTKTAIQMTQGKITKATDIREDLILSGDVASTMRIFIIRWVTSVIVAELAKSGAEYTKADCATHKA